MLQERLYEGRGIPKGTKPYRVKAVLEIFEDRLRTELNKRYVWHAIAARAVYAGYWGGERRRKRRIKLLKIINECRAHLGQPQLAFPEGWARHRLFYGFDTRERIVNDHLELWIRNRQVGDGKEPLPINGKVLDREPNAEEIEEARLAISTAVGMIAASHVIAKAEVEQPDGI